MKTLRIVPSAAGGAVALLVMSVVGVALIRAQNEGDSKSKQPAPRRETRQPQAADQERAPDGREGRRAEARPSRKGLGIQLEGQGEGLRVTAVEEGGLAARGGMRQNDRIVSIDGRPFTNARHVQAYLASQAGRRVPIVIDRDGQKYTVTVTPPVREEDGAWLGVFLEEGDAKAKGARITHVYPAGPASRAGLDEGDVIVKVEGKPIESSADLIFTVQEMKPQSQAEFVVLRDDAEVTIPVILGSRNASFFMPPRGDDEEDDADDPQSERTRPDGEQAAQRRHFRNGRDAFENIQPYSMQLEHDRRQSEQHERIENEIRLLREEIAKLREELKRK